jgi:hypothetical protein
MVAAHSAPLKPSNADLLRPSRPLDRDPEGHLPLDALVGSGVHALLNIEVNEEEHLLVQVDLGYEKFQALQAVVCRASERVLTVSRR